MRFQNARRLLRITLVILIIAIIPFQLIAPLVANEVALFNPEVSHLVLPYSICAVGALCALQVILVALWLLAGNVETPAYYGRRSLKWLTLIQVATVFAAGLPTLGLAHAIWFVQVRHVMVTLGFIGFLTLGICFYALVSIGRFLYLQHTSAHDELEYVI